jgi:hypothetical protein
MSPAARDRRALAWGTLAVGLAGSACTHGEPPTPAGSPSVAPLAVQGATEPAPTSARSEPAADAEASPPHAPLGQTRDKPSATGPAFEGRRDALWGAIVHDDPDRAMPFFFPLEAYQQVKGVPDPGADWRRRLVAAYKHDIHALHAKLGDEAEGATLVTMTVTADQATWVDPGDEWNKVGYYRVYGSKLHFTRPGRTKDETFDVKSLISWRGEWFVVHLSAIK